MCTWRRTRSNSNLENRNCEQNKRLHSELLRNNPLPTTNHTDCDISLVMPWLYSDCINKKKHLCYQLSHEKPCFIAKVSGAGTEHLWPQDIPYWSRSVRKEPTTGQTPQHHRHYRRDQHHHIITRLKTEQKYDFFWILWKRQTLPLQSRKPYHLNSSHYLRDGKLHLVTPKLGRRPWQS